MLWFWFCFSRATITCLRQGAYVFLKSRLSQVYDIRWLSNLFSSVLKFGEISWRFNICLIVSTVFSIWLCPDTQEAKNWRQQTDRNEDATPEADSKMWSYCHSCSLRSSKVMFHFGQCLWTRTLLIDFAKCRLLTGAILAHELMHGWLRLKGICPFPFFSWNNLSKWDVFKLFITPSMI